MCASAARYVKAAMLFCVSSVSAGPACVWLVGQGIPPHVVWLWSSAVPSVGAKR